MTTADLSTQTPAEIDTALADIYTRYYSVVTKIEQHDKWIEDMEQGISKHESGEHGYRYSSYTPERLHDLLSKRDSLTAQTFSILAESNPYEDEFDRRPWSRFFLVDNHGGHVHSSRRCSTCNNGKYMTRFGWLPTLSGQTEEQAVAEQGAILCTVCYPSAPVEWTQGKKDDSCAGSGRYVNRDLPNRTGYYSGNWGTCEVCDTRQTVTKGFRLRKHKTLVQA